MINITCLRVYCNVYTQRNYTLSFFFILSDSIYWSETYCTIVTQLIVQYENIE